MADDTGALRVTDGAGTQTWTMDFPPVNAIDPAFLNALDAQLTAAQRREDVAVVVLASAQKVFSAGADAGWMAQVARRDGLPALLEQFNATMDAFRELCLRMRRSPLLIVAALGGHTLAGGLELAAACDLRHAADADRLRIGVPEMDLFGAMPSGGGGAQYLARLMGPSQALRFILDAKPITPREAAARGLVDQLFAPEALLEETQAIAAAIAAKAGRIGVSAAKRAVFTGVELPLHDAMVLDRSVHWDAMRRGNFLPGVAAFVEQYG